MIYLDPSHAISWKVDPAYLWASSGIVHDGTRSNAINDLVDCLLLYIDRSASGRKAKIDVGDNPIEQVSRILIWAQSRPC